MELEKNLIIDSFIKPEVGDSPYDIKLENSSELTFDRETLKKYKINPSKNLKGKTLSVILKSREVEKGKARTLTDITKDDVLIKNVDKINRQSREGIPIRDFYYVHESLTYSAYFETFFVGGSVSPMHIPFYKLKLELDEKEYNQLRDLPSNTVMKFSCKVGD